MSAQATARQLFEEVIAASSRAPAEADPASRIFERASERRDAKALAYAGEVTPEEAWQLHRGGAARLVDVRTRPEWEFVGRVRGAHRVEWRRYGETEPHRDFLAELGRVAKPGEAVLFLCRSGVRSHHAAEAAAQAGYARAYNILEGFEGVLDSRGRRGSLGGWRAAGLPWEQD